FITAISIIFFQQVIIDTLLPERLDDMQIYVSSGNDAMQLNDLYQNSIPAKKNTWPPFFSFFIIPLSLTANYFGKYIAKELWYLLNYVWLIWTIKIWTFILIKENPKFISDSQLDFTSPNIFLPVLFIIPAIMINFLHLQINTLILFLLTLGFYYYQKDKAFLAGTMIGLAASIKAFPGLFLIYFLIRKQWKIAGWIFMMGGLFTVVPALFYGIEAYIELMRRWLSMSLQEKYVVGCDVYANQSLYAMWEYYLVCRFNITEAASPLIHLMTKSSTLILFVISMSIFLRTKYDKDSTFAVIEFSSVCILMILFSPIAWRHYWVHVYLASAFSYIYLKKNPRFFRKKEIKILMFLWVLLLIMPDNSITEFSPLAPLFRSLGFYTWSAIILNSLLLMIHIYSSNKNSVKLPPEVVALPEVVV
ncbi:glycosyltransferase 87 family protein, partial [Chloroflexota bacterium]